MANRNDLTEAFHKLSGTTMDSAAEIARTKFLRLGSWREDDIQRYVDDILPGIDNAKRTMSNYAVGYYGQVAGVSGQTFKAVSVPATALATEALRNGTTAKMIWERPFKEMWTKLSKGADFSDALAAGSRRADYIARTEIQLAKRQAGLVARNGNTNIVGYLRTLSGAENCGLCYIASTQRYTRGDLLPIHPGCDCGETPIYGNTDVGQVIDNDILNATHEAVEQRFGASDATGREIDYRKITIQDHGELGPYLTVKGHDFTKVTPQDLKTPIKAPKAVTAAVKTTFAERIQSKLQRISAQSIVMDIKAEHGEANVRSLKGKAKIQTLGEKTSGHLDAVKAVGKDVDKEIQNRVAKAVNDLSDPKVVAATKAAIEAGENLLVQTKLKYEAGYQKLIADELAKVNAEISVKYKAYVARGTDKEFLDSWLGQYTEEKKLRLAGYNASNAYNRSPAGKTLLIEISELDKELTNLRNELPASIIPGNVKYNQIYADKTLEVLREVREVGIGGPKFVGDALSNDILDQGRKVYPSSWLDAAERKFGVIGTKRVARGYFNEYTSTIAVSFDRGAGFANGYATAVHEMGHMFEASVPGLKELEFAYAHQRAASNPARTKLGAKEVGFQDEWRNLYTGKDYGYETDSSYEIFTTGIESVYSGSDLFNAPKSTSSNYFNKSLGTTQVIDDEFRQFVLGALFSL